MLLLHPAFRIVNCSTAKAKLHSGIIETSQGNYRQVNLYMGDRKPCFETGLCNHTASLRWQVCSEMKKIGIPKLATQFGILNLSKFL
jgi:hypothetical protein